MRVVRSTAIFIAVLGLASGVAQADFVTRRGAEPPLEGQITSLDSAGVHLRAASGAEHFVPWDRVRAIDPPSDPVLDRRMKTALELWRARTRVERGDPTLAEPLLERLFEAYRGETHETARVVAEGLLRCRLARGANALAVIPALETARLARAGVETTSYRMLPPVLDPATTLCPQIAPVWVESRILAKVERDLGAYDAQGDAVVARIAALYRRAVRHQLRLPAEPDAEPVAEPIARGGEDARGVALLQLMLACNEGSSDARRDARARCLIGLDARPDWAGSWIRFAVGVSLLRESGLGRHQRGIVQILHVPARDDGELPYLSGLALAWASAASRVDGDDRAAVALIEELARTLPNHPALAVPEPVRLPPADRPDERQKGNA